MAFRRLAVFAGGFALEGARRVCPGGPAGAGGVLGALARLVDKSLVVAEDRAGSTRYRMLETVRHYAVDRLREAGEEAAVRDRHLACYLEFVEQAEPELDRDKDAWRTRLEAEHENLRAALDWGLAAEDPSAGRRLAAGLPWLWHLHGHGLEGFEVLRRAVSRAPAERSALQARLLAGIAVVADTAGPLELEFDVAQQALELAAEHGEERLCSLCLELAAIGHFYTDFDAAWQLNLQARRAAERAGDAMVLDGSRALEGIILHLRDRHDEARPLMQAAVEGLLRRGDRGIAATTLAYQATGELCTGDVRLARRIAERAVQVAEPLGDYHRVGSSRSVLAIVEGLGGDPAAGLRVTQPVVRLVDDAGAEVFVPWMARVMGTLHLLRGQPAEATRWLELEAQSADRDTATYLAAQTLPVLGAALRQLGRGDQALGVLGRAVSLARKLDMPRVLADALEQQAHLAAASDPDQAALLHHQALAIRVEHRLRTFCPDSLDAIGSIAARAGRTDLACRLLAASGAARDAMGYPRCGPDRQAHDVLVIGLQRALGAREFAAAWAAGADLSLDDAVAYARRPRGPRDRPSSGWASLTPTEVAVVRLAAEGHSNPEISARLFMSRGTVKTHLLHAYAKLGVTNRTELATLAARMSPVANRT